MERVYKIRQSKSGPTKRTVYRLTVPPQIATKLDPEIDFTVELTEEGILYRPVEEAREMPSWARRKK
jgi:hypothetical protein